MGELCRIVRHLGSGIVSGGTQLWTLPARSDESGAILSAARAIPGDSNEHVMKTCDENAVLDVVCEALS